jgi:hypothetical protein
MLRSAEAQLEISSDHYELSGTESVCDSRLLATVNVALG